MSKMTNSISDIINLRHITEVLHFTSNNGLLGTIDRGILMSRRQLPEVSHLAYLAAPTSAIRQEGMSHFDKQKDWLDYVNLSISEINTRYFKFAKRLHKDNQDKWWAILSFSPEIITHEGVYFCTTNNIYEKYVIRMPGATGLNNLFNAKICLKENWTVYRLLRRENLPTCEQAEVLYPSAVSIKFLQKIYVEREEHFDCVNMFLAKYKLNNISVIIDENKFSGMPN
jgi:hypothetical protein